MKLSRLFTGCSILLITICSVVLAVDCVSDLGDRSIAGIHKASDGYYHITYSFAPGTPDAVQTAAADAFSQWNGMSGTTKVIFEPASAGAIGFIEFKESDDPSNSAGCAGFKKGSDRVYFTSGFAAGAGQNNLNRMAAATIIAHELGHFLGLGEEGLNPDTPSIMNNGDPQWGCPEAGTHMPTTEVQASDASKVVDCITLAQQTRTSGAGGDAAGFYYNPPSAYGGGCYDRYLVTTYYNCSANSCTYVGETWTYLYTWCDGGGYLN